MSWLTKTLQYRLSKALAREFVTEDVMLSKVKQETP